MTAIPIYKHAPAMSRPPRPAPMPVAEPVRFAQPAPLAATASPAGREPLRLVPSPSPTDDVDHQLLTILHARPEPGETLDHAFRRKELAIAGVFEALSIAASREMHRRLSNPRPGDALATRFALLVVERRGRLLAFLADARRREALRR